MKSPIILAVMLLASPAMAGESSIAKTTPPTELEICTIRLRDTSDLLQQLIRKVSAPVPAAVAPLPQSKPAVQVKAKPRACPILKGKQKCKRGRTQSPSHNCKCGVWPPVVRSSARSAGG